MGLCVPNLTRLVDTLFDSTLPHFGGFDALFCMASWVAREQERCSLVTVCEQNPKCLVDGCRFCSFARHAIRHLEIVCPLCQIWDDFVRLGRCRASVDVSRRLG